ncbi:glycolipid 2-alpha-mannosyltransferase-domain-containing protein [Talaromyces proteolyticus]|uniref:Glycolipid 2-alpha-mannosyltransferase-domain-containing protein n=1 Tax=Talaromyces proteolyticus TaxID=1131652 RepID=A0AAD4L4S2_9EURO|nr:glycolipid 2-alpha-mannosyltransferase-domain-containing protein [Talaromyces proteolyticus]KAH8703557.1 glycolipid 2-alpha-mannosyltransferase-domain-containing protein [Talaromyces proteolyticus]
MISNKLRKWSRNAVVGLCSVLLLFAAYLHYDYDAWYLSSGDRALAQMNFAHLELPTPQAIAGRANATLISLVRNEELKGIISSMRQLERSWNSKYNYPWIFFNDVPFTEEFKERTQAETSAECHYALIPKEHWEIPEWIDDDLLKQAIQRQQSQKIKYAKSLSYHQMCRWNSGFFYRHPILDNYKYYWRVEPDVKYFCDINYDLFQFMADHNKVYGFTINIFDDPASVETLWPQSMAFLEEHPDYLSADNSMTWLTDNTLRPENTLAANGYSTCHFWSNFEIADLDFWRSEKYQQYFDHLDKAGGFFYERWGDAPVHSVALGLFADNSQIHWFRDVGYEHPPYINCPSSPNCQNCQPNIFTHDWVLQEDCRLTWFKQLCESRARHGGMGPEENEICRQSMNLSSYIT